MSHPNERNTVDMKSEYIPHYYERNIVDIKYEYTAHLFDILVPRLYEGICMVYERAQKHHAKYEKLIQMNSNIKQQSIVVWFQKCLQDVPNITTTGMEQELKRIKEKSMCSDIFDTLVMAVIKSYIVLLTYNASGKTCRLVVEKYHDKINIVDFIHKCYIECAQSFHNNPELIMETKDPELLRIQKDNSYKVIKKAIVNAIHKVLPMREILDEYLTNDYIIERNFKQKLDRYVSPPRDNLPPIYENEDVQNKYSVIQQGAGEDVIETLSHEGNNEMMDVVKVANSEPIANENMILDPLAQTKILDVENKEPDGGIVIDNIQADGKLIDAKDVRMGVQQVPQPPQQPAPIIPTKPVENIMKVDEKEMNDFFQSIEH